MAPHRTVSRNRGPRIRRAKATDRHAVSVASMNFDSPAQLPWKKDKARIFQALSITIDLFSRILIITILYLPQPTKEGCTSAFFFAAIIDISPAQKHDCYWEE